MGKVSVKSSTFPDTVGTFPATDFTNLNGNTGEVRVVSANTVFTPYTPVSDARAIGTFTADQYATLTLTGFTRQTGTADELGVDLRLGTGVVGGAGVSGYEIRISDASTSNLKVYKVVTGTATQIGSTITGNWSNGDVLEAWIVGTTITVYQNGSSILSFTDATFSTGNPGVVAKLGGDTLRGNTFDSGNITGNTPVNPGAGSVALTGYAPTVAQTLNQAANPGAGSVAITGYPPVVSQGGSSPVTAFPGTGSLAITGYAPTVSVAAAGPQSVTPGQGNIVIAGYAPTVLRTNVGSLTSPFPLKNNTATALPSTGNLTVAVVTALGAFVVTKAGLTTDASGLLSFSDPAVNAGTPYIVLILDPAGSAIGCFRATAV